MFHCSTIRCSTIPASRFFYFTIRCSHCSIMIDPRFHHQMFHCSTIRYSAVPLPDFPLFHHLCSTDPPSLLDCSTTRYSTVSPSDVLQFRDDCSTIPPLDGPLFHYLCFTFPLYLFHFFTMIVPLCYHEIFDCSTICVPLFHH